MASTHCSRSLELTAVACLIGALLAPDCASAALSIVVRDAQGQPLAGAAVAVYAPESGARIEHPTAVIDKKNEQFVPNFLVVHTGTDVSFPNSDQVLHHVYSFSPAKIFELPLYKGVLPSPIRFDREGIVVLGCNIHDRMIAHIWVVDAPIRVLTDGTGHARIDVLPEGHYRVLAWHPRAGRDGVRAMDLGVGADGNGTASVDLAVAKPLAEHGALSWHDTY